MLARSRPRAGKAAFGLPVWHRPCGGPPVAVCADAEVGFDGVGFCRSGHLLRRRPRQLRRLGLRCRIQIANLPAPTVELLLGHASFRVHLVLKLLCPSLPPARSPSAARSLHSLKADLDRRLRRQVGRQLADRAFAELRAVVGRKAFPFDDLHQDRSSGPPCAFENAPGDDRQRRVAGNENRIPRPLGLRVGGHDAQAVRIDVANAETSAICPGDTPRSTRHAAPPRGPPLRPATPNNPAPCPTAPAAFPRPPACGCCPPTSSTRSMSLHSRPAACSVCRVVNDVRSSRSCVMSSNCCRVTSTRTALPR